MEERREIIDVRTVDSECEAILVKRHKAHPAGEAADYEFVTWLRRKDSRENTFWGHYYGHNLDGATKDFYERR